jgi:hypothetical protein
MGFRGGKTMSKKLTPYQRIMRAAERGTGMRLSADEVAELASDGAISALAETDNYIVTATCARCGDVGECYVDSDGQYICNNYDACVYRQNRNNR